MWRKRRKACIGGLTGPKRPWPSIPGKRCEPKGPLGRGLLVIDKVRQGALLVDSQDGFRQEPAQTDDLERERLPLREGDAIRHDDLTEGEGLQTLDGIADKQSMCRDDS